MKDEGKMYEMLMENGHGSGSSPMRLQSLDFGESFDLLAEQIKNMNLAVGDGKITKLDTAKMPETEEVAESMSEKWKRKARGAGKKVEDEGKGDGYGELFLAVIKSLDDDDEDEEDKLSQHSGYYTPSVYSEQGKKSNSIAKLSTNTVR